MVSSYRSKKSGMNIYQNVNTSNLGRVFSVRGSIIDIHFPESLPEIFNQLKAGEDGKIIIEVVSHVSAEIVRGIALTPTSGLARGSTVINTGHHLQVPVGKYLLGRMFNVFGEAIDGKESLFEGEWRSIHQPSISLAQQSIKSEILETGIKIIDVLAPLERGGKAGLFGGAGVGKTVLITEMIHNMVSQRFKQYSHANFGDFPAFTAQTPPSRSANPTFI